MSSRGARPIRRKARVAIATAALLTVGCGDVHEGSTGESGEVVVFAAASLTEAFTEIGEAFEAARPDTSVTFNFAASSELVAQILEGAPADVYASADLDNMARLTGAGAAATEPEVFARNRAEIVVAEGNPLGVETVADLADPDLVVITCAPEAPCGSYATRIFRLAGVEMTPDSYEQNVKAVVTKVRLGEADAGIAYATDVAADDDGVDGVPIPDEQNVVAEYPIAVTVESTNPTAAAAFLGFVLGPAGRTVLTDHGFGSP